MKIISTIFFVFTLIPISVAFANSDKQSWTEKSASSFFSSSIQAKDGEYKIGQYHDWIIKMNDRQGNPVKNARIKISGGMLGHGHGLPSQPLITQYLGDGKYLIEGMLFNMTGDWTLAFKVKTPDFNDHVRFEATLVN